MFAQPRRSNVRGLSAILVVLTLIGCSTRDEHDAPDSGMTSSATAQPPAAGSLEGAAAAAGIRKALGGAYGTRTLTMSDVERLSVAVRNIRQLQASDPDVGRHMEEEMKARKISAIQAVAEEPRLLEAIRRAGLTPEDYFQISTSLVQAMTVAAMMRPDAGAMRLREIPPGMPRENVAFVQEHEAEIRKLIQMGG
jgi:hypothetical protein